MKQLYFLITFFFVVAIYSQKEKKPLSGMISCNESQNVHLIFPDNIKQATTGSKYFRFSYNKNQPDKLGLLKGHPDAPEASSLFVVTANGDMYSFVVEYSSQLSKPNFFVSKKTSIGSLNEEPEADQKNKKVLFDLNKMSRQKSLKKNKPNVQLPLKSDDKTKPVEKEKYILINNSKSNSEFKTINAYNRKKNKNESLNNEGNDDELYKWHKDEYMRKTCVYKGKPYYKGNMTKVVNKKNSLFLSNIVYDRNELYFFFEMENKSGLDYEINFVNFAVDLRKKSKKSSAQQILKKPIYEYKVPKKIARDGKERMAYVFDKFSISSSKIFCIEVNEKNGERNLFLTIDSETINNPN